MELNEFYSDTYLEDELFRALERDALFSDYTMGFDNAPDESLLYSDDPLIPEVQDVSTKNLVDDYDFNFLEWQHPLLDDFHNVTSKNSKEILEATVNDPVRFPPLDGFRWNDDSSLAMHEVLTSKHSSSSININSPEEAVLPLSLEALDVHSLFEKFEASASENQEGRQCDRNLPSDVPIPYCESASKNGSEKSSQSGSYILDHQYCSPQEKRSKIIDFNDEYYNKIPDYIQGVKILTDSECANTSKRLEKNDDNTEKDLPLDTPKLPTESSCEYSKIPSYLMDVGHPKIILQSENAHLNEKSVSKNLKRTSVNERNIRPKDNKSTVEDSSSSIYSWDQKHYGNSEFASWSVLSHPQEKQHVSTRRNQKPYYTNSSHLSKRSFLYSRKVDDFKPVPFKACPPRRLQKPWLCRDEKYNQVDDRRIIYVGNVPEGTTKADLRIRFSKFGVIEDVSVHFREQGDNYGFVTFSCKKAAFTAIEHGNDDSSLPKYDLCFGGRRHFCQSSYSDLDALNSGSSLPAFKASRRDLDFDSLLHAAKAKVFKR